MNSKSLFPNKVAVITGAGSGIGRALAKQLADSGARLALADLTQSGLDGTVSSLPAQTIVTTYAVDVADREAYRTFIPAALTPIFRKRVSTQLTPGQARKNCRRQLDR
jgi:NAD(P)-dependent dehydrogenase (short-subunit alcohol dehydrogenase family)